MAILKGIKVTIVVNGQNLHEYDDEDADSNTQSCVSRYVEATSGAEFQIKSSAPCSYTFTSDAVGVEVYVDGTRVQMSLQLKTDRPHGNSAWKRTCEGAERCGKNGWVVRPFTFTELVISDLPSLATGQELANDLVANIGSIVIRCFRKRLLGKQALYSSHSDLQHMGEAPKFAEKELKGQSVTHGTRLGDEQSSKANRRYRTKYVDDEDSPIATFIFKYRSRKALKSLLLIDRTPSPPREPTPIPLEERDIDSLTPDELRELSRRQQARYRMEREANAKNEGGGKAEPSIKTERGFKRERDEEYDNIIASASVKKAKPPFTNGEIIELDD